MFDYRKVFGGMKIHNPSYFDLTRRVPTFRPTPLAGAKALFHRQVQANVSWTAWRHPREYWWHVIFRSNIELTKLMIGEFISWTIFSNISSDLSSWIFFRWDRWGPFRGLLQFSRRKAPDFSGGNHQNPVENHHFPSCSMAIWRLLLYFDAPHPTKVIFWSWVVKNIPWPKHHIKLVHYIISHESHEISIKTPFKSHEISINSF